MLQFSTEHSEHVFEYATVVVAVVVVAVNVVAQVYQWIRNCVNQKAVHGTSV